MSLVIHLVLVGLIGGIIWHFHKLSVKRRQQREIEAQRIYNLIKDNPQVTLENRTLPDGTVEQFIHIRLPPSLIKKVAQSNAAEQIRIPLLHLMNLTNKNVPTTP